VRMLIVGAGSAGRKHYAALEQIEPDIEVAFVDTDPKVDADFRKLEDALEMECHWQAAVIATPPPHLASLATECMRAGLHVLIEKPVCLNREQGHNLLETAADCSVAVRTGYMHRHQPDLVTSIFESDAIQITMGYDLRAIRNPVPRYFHEKGGGAVWDIASHALSLVRQLGYLEVVGFQLHHVSWSPMPVRAAIQLQAGGKPVQILAGADFPCRICRARLISDEGFQEIELVGNALCFERQMASFLDAIEGPSTMAELEDAMEISRICEEVMGE